VGARLEDLAVAGERGGVNGGAFGREGGHDAAPVHAEPEDLLACERRLGGEEEARAWTPAKAARSISTCGSLQKLFRCSGRGVLLNAATLPARAKSSHASLSCAGQNVSAACRAKPRAARLVLHVRWRGGQAEEEGVFDASEARGTVKGGEHAGRVSLRAAHRKGLVGVECPEEGESNEQQL